MSRSLSTRNISSTSMHAFLSNLANRQTFKRGQTHLPPPLSKVIIHLSHWYCYSFIAYNIIFYCYIRCIHVLKLLTIISLSMTLHCLMCVCCIIITIVDGLLNGRSFKLVLFESCVQFSVRFYSNYGAILYRLRDIARYWLKIAIFLYPIIFSAPAGGEHVGILRRCLTFKN